MVRRVPVGQEPDQRAADDAPTLRHRRHAGQHLLPDRDQPVAIRSPGSRRRSQPPGPSPRRTRPPASVPPRGALLFKLNTSVYSNRPLTLQIHAPGSRPRRRSRWIFERRRRSRSAADREPPTRGPSDPPTLRFDPLATGSGCSPPWRSRSSSSAIPGRRDRTPRSSSSGSPLGLRAGISPGCGSPIAAGASGAARSCSAARRQSWRPLFAVAGTGRLEAAVPAGRPAFARRASSGDGVLGRRAVGDRFDVQTRTARHSQGYAAICGKNGRPGRRADPERQQAARPRVRRLGTEAADRDKPPRPRRAAARRARSGVAGRPAERHGSLFRALTGATVGQLVALPGNRLLSSVATARRCGPRSQRPAGRPAPARLLTPKTAAPQTLSATVLRGNRTALAWTAAAGRRASTVGPARHHGRRRHRDARAGSPPLAVTMAPGHRSTSSRSVGAPPANSPGSRAGTTRPGRCIRSSSWPIWAATFTPGRSRSRDCWPRGCRSRPTPVARRSSRGRRVTCRARAGSSGRQGRPRAVRPADLAGRIDPGEAPAAAVSPRGAALVGWVDAGRVLAAERGRRAGRFAPTRVVSGTSSAMDLTLGFGPSAARWRPGRGDVHRDGDGGSVQPCARRLHLPSRGGAGRGWADGREVRYMVALSRAFDVNPAEREVGYTRVALVLACDVLPPIGDAFVPFATRAGPGERGRRWARFVALVALSSARKT